LDAFQQGLVELLPRMRRLARSLCRDAAAADDLVQQASLRALSARDQWTPGTRLDSWVFTIMKRLWIDEGRSRARWTKVLAPAEEGERVADAAVSSPEQRLEAARVAEAMAALPNDQRLAVALVLVDGLSYREAAEVLEVPVGTLTSRLVRGRQALLARLEQEGIAP